jgi:diguanylate cyclase
MKEKASLWINLHRRDRSGRWPARLMLWAVISSFVIGLVGFAQPLDDLMRDLRNGMRRQAASGDIVIVAIDDTSLEQMAKWPWPRRYHAAIINNLKAHGAERIFLDIDFSSESNPVDDGAFEAALKAHQPPVTLPVHHIEEITTGRKVDLLPIELFKAHVDLATINYEFGFMGFARRLSYNDEIAGNLYPSFASKLARVSGAPGEKFTIDYSINPRTIPVVRAVDVFENRIDPAVVAGKTVILGATSFQLRDLFLSPSYGFLPGVYLHAMGAETLKSGVPIHVGWLLPFLFALLLATVISVIKDARVAIGALLAASVALPVIPLQFEQRLIFVDIMPALILLLIVGCSFGWTSFRNLQRFRGSTNSLSGLPNLNALRHETVGQDAPLVVLEVQNFAEVTSALSHQAEETLIKQIAHRLGIVFPFSKLYQNDEGIFAWFVDPMPVEDLGSRLDTLHHLFRTPLTAGHNQVDLTLGLGVEIGSERVIANRLGSARVAAEEALRSGLRWKQYDPAKLQDAGWKLSLLGQLDSAIDSGGLFVEFQPKLEIASHRIIGAEALVRWNHPEKGLINPLEFILAAEQGGRIGKLTDYVLRRSIEAAVKLNTSGKPFGMAVNMSARLLNEAGLAASISTLLAEYGLPGTYLTLEITETAALAGSGSDMKALSELRDMGVQISIDDYGTGLSTLDYLKRIPATEIKIDRSFVQSIDRNHSDRVMVLSTIRLAHSLGQKVVAEGVERQETLDQLAVMGCDIAQGFYIGRPMSLEALGSMLAARRKAA